MKKLFLLLVSTALISCADQTKRQKHLESLYPKCKVEPATGLIQREGYDFIVIDSTMQIIAVDFYPFSESKISFLRNIR
jgi:hypothetical protein